MTDMCTPTSPERLSDQLQRPTAEAIWNRAVEILGDEVKAKIWMNSRREIFDGRSPEQLVATADGSQLRRVLEVLVRIDYGVFS
jgi:uncharacterized protein (DUF2384 family)